MKSLKFTMILAMLLGIGTFAVAQDYSEYLNAAKRLLKEEKCDDAKKNYDVYVRLTGQTVSWLSSDINDCITRKSKPKTYNIGDDAKDFVGYSGYKIAYLDESGKHGFAVRPGTVYEYSEYAISDVAIDELRLMYNNKHSLGLYGEYWSSTKVPGTGSAFTMEKYYTFNFSTRTTNERRSGRKEKYKVLNIKRF